MRGAQEAGPPRDAGREGPGAHVQSFRTAPSSRTHRGASAAAAGASAGAAAAAAEPEAIPRGFSVSACAAMLAARPAARPQQVVIL